MRRTLLAALALCCLAKTAHAAQGVNLRWDACAADGGVLNKNFACDTNTGTETLVLSVTLDQDFTPVTGVEFMVNFATPSGLPSSWWQFRSSGACRRTALAVQNAPPASSTCLDPWQGQATGGLADYSVPWNNTAQYRMFAVLAVPSQTPATFFADEEYFLARITISHAATTGTGSCSGCAAPACIGVGNVKVFRPVGLGDVRVATESSPGSSSVSWQGSPVITDFVHNYAVHPGSYQDYRVLACQTTSRSENRTWGSIKSLYH